MQGNATQHSPSQRLFSAEAMLWLIAFANIILILFTFRDYGFTVDESNGYQRALNIYKFLSSYGQDTSTVTTFDVHTIYGAMPDVLAIFLQKLFPALGFDARHLVSAVFGAVGVYYSGRIAAQLAGPWVGVIAALLLVLCPFWTGYSFLNLKDIPFAASLSGGLYAAMRLFDPGNKRLWPACLMLGIWGGALATSKLTGILFLGFCTLFIFVFGLLEGKTMSLRDFAIRLALASISGILGVALFCLFFWPQIYFYSLEQTYMTITAFLHFPGWRGQVLLGGQNYNYDAIPLSYPLTYLVINLPLAIWPLYLAGLALAAWNRSWRVLGLALLPILFLALQALTHAVVYNGARHFLFILPMIAATAAYGAAKIASYHHVGKAVAAGLLVAYAGAAIYNTVTLYPYQYSSYNMLVGGLSGAQGKYYVDVWRSAFREALRTISAQANTTTTVFSCGSVVNYVDFPNLRPTPKMEEADYIVALPRGCALETMPTFPKIAEVRRGDVLFATIMVRPKN